MKYSTNPPRRLRATGPRRALAVLALGILGAGLGTAPAVAAPGDWETEHSEWGETTEDTCGIEGLTVQDVGSGDSRIRFVARGADDLQHFESYSVDTDVYTNLANDRSVSVVENRYGRDVTVTDNGDGTLTVIELFSGHKTVYDADGNVLERAAGSVMVELVWDHAGTPADRDDDEFVSFRFLRSSGDQLDFCDDVIPALT